MSRDEMNLQLLALYHDEWKFRHTNFWRRVPTFFALIFIVSTFPITAQFIFSAEPETLTGIPLVLFPVVGIALTLLFLWFCLSEAVRMNSVGDKMRAIINDHFAPRYQKIDLPPLLAWKDKQKHNRAARLFRMRMSLWVPFSLSAMLFCVALFMICWLRHQ